MTSFAKGLLIIVCGFIAVIIASILLGGLMTHPVATVIIAFVAVSIVSACYSVGGLWPPRS